MVIRSDLGEETVERERERERETLPGVQRNILCSNMKSIVIISSQGG